MPDSIREILHAIERGAPKLDVAAAPDTYLRRAMETYILTGRYVEWLERQPPDEAKARSKLAEIIKDDRVAISQEASRMLAEIEAYYVKKAVLDQIKSEIHATKPTLAHDLTTSFVGALLAPIAVYLLIFALNLTRQNVSLSQFFDLSIVLSGGT